MKQYVPTVSEDTKKKKKKKKDQPKASAVSKKDYGLTENAKVIME